MANKEQTARGCPNYKHTHTFIHSRRLWPDEEVSNLWVWDWNYVGCASSLWQVCGAGITALAAGQGSHWGSETHHWSCGRFQWTPAAPGLPADAANAGEQLTRRDVSVPVQLLEAHLHLFSVHLVHHEPGLLRHYLEYELVRWQCLLEFGKLSTFYMNAK